MVSDKSNQAGRDLR